MPAPHLLGVVWLTVALAGASLAEDAGNQFIVLAHEGYAAAIAGDDEAAIRAFEAALAIEPGRLEAAVYLIQLYRKTGRNTDALDRCRRVLERHPDDVETLYLLAATHSGLRDPKAAVAALEHACRVDPYHARAHLLLGQEYVTLGEFAPAIEALTRVRVWRPENDLLHRYLGQAYLGTGQTDEAEQSLMEAARLAPFAAQPYFHLGRLYRMLGNADRSREMMERFQALQVRSQERERLSRAARQNPDDARGWFLLADHYMRGGQAREALSPMGSAIEADAGNASYRDMRAHVYLRLGITEEAKGDAIAAIRLDPTVGAYYNTLGTCSMSESKPGMASEAFREAIRVGGDVPAFHLNLSRALDALGDIDGAERHRQIAGDRAK
ncbi:tetratricopeptide repeat protein [Candidatus Poribacteria bacterium]|jgi:tetratricopeptide (TPR) repeat protein|nr:tetratricopeptide repeat protein [Candidatus Poribacteria bacterium]MBT5532552.1 tetratricopeptide repeat protein [Candidatus Poribacteria bacterium]MBT5710004.1 tetratricopeptide repeat protein [Candidatus Poribacteria bacterium]MBT7096731.1 tetratricopeptide repeat protein [Candidatus Poribacteria bacterium]MBT7809119.1 tetratricopeptide repeat protein [Candidatus Poribacteria bacterium]